MERLYFPYPKCLSFLLSDEEFNYFLLNSVYFDKLYTIDLGEITLQLKTLIFNVRRFDKLNQLRVERLIFSFDPP